MRREENMIIHADLTAVNDSGIKKIIDTSLL
jgi:hypothetical protein